jgi:alpha-tubulin suppressor-like RCC1 family protein
VYAAAVESDDSTNDVGIDGYAAADDSADLLTALTTGTGTDAMLLRYRIKEKHVGNAIYAESVDPTTAIDPAADTSAVLVGFRYRRSTPYDAQRANYVQAYKHNTAGTEAVFASAAYSNWGSVKPQKGPNDVVLAAVATDNADDVTRVEIIPGLFATSVKGGGTFTMSLSADGVVYAFGNGAQGRLGIGGGGNKTTPVPVTGGSLTGKTVTAVVGGGTLTLALDSDGVVHAWGHNNTGQTGQGVIGNVYTTPVAVTGGSLTGKTVTAVSTGTDHSFALDSDGLLHAFGWNLFGQLGVGGTAPRSIPVLVTGGSLAGKTVTAVYGGWRFSLALDSEGGVHAWGDNTYGQIGQGNFDVATYETPVAVTGGSLAGKTVTTAAIGHYHVLALVGTEIHAWGRNHVGQLGDGSTSDANEPVQISGYSAAAVAGGEISSYVLGTDGVVYAFGGGSDGQLAQGPGDTGNKATPVPIVPGSLTGKTVIAIDGGWFHAFALDSDGGVHAWGRNSSGQLGVGDTVRRTTPVAVDPPFTPPVPMTYAYKFDQVSFYYLHDSETRTLGGARVVFANSATSKVLLLHTLKDVADVSFVPSKTIGSNDSLVAENPRMTDNSTAIVAGTVWESVEASWLVQTSSVHNNNTNNVGWKAFNKTNVDFNDGWHSEVEGMPQSISIKYPTAQSLASYSITSRNHTGPSKGYPISFTLQGSEDGTDESWVDLDVRSNLSWSINETKAFTLSAPSAQYSYFRLYVTVSSHDFVFIGEWQLFTSRAAPLALTGSDWGTGDHLFVYAKAVESDDSTNDVGIDGYSPSADSANLLTALTADARLLRYQIREKHVGNAIYAESVDPGIGVDPAADTSAVLMGFRFRRSTPYDARRANYVQAYKHNTAGTEAVFASAAYSNWGSVTPQKGPNDVVLATVATDDVTRVEIIPDLATAVDAGLTVHRGVERGRRRVHFRMERIRPARTGDRVDRLTPVPITGGSLTGKTVTAVAAGNQHTLAIDSDGVIHGWGRNHASSDWARANHRTASRPCSSRGGR